MPEPTKVSLVSAADTPAPKTTDTTPVSSDKDIAEASLAKLNDLQSKLRNSITDNISDPAKSALLQRLETESNLAEKSGIDRLDYRGKNDKSTTRLEDGSLHLNQLQQKTKNLFNEKLAGEAAASAINTDLANMHKMRRDLLEQHLREEDQKLMDDAYRKVLNMVLGPGVGDKKVLAHDVGSKPMSNFLNDLRNSQPPVLKSDTGDWIKEDADGVLESNNPELLGTACVAAGYKKVEFDGPPWKAIRAAKAALAAGLQEATLSKATQKLLQDPEIFNSYDEYINALNEFRLITQWSMANRTARANHINNVFNKDPKKLSDRAEVFNQLDTPEHLPAQKEMVNRLSPKEQAELALELEDKGYKRGDKIISGYEAVRSLIDKPRFDTARYQNAFDIAYNYQKAEKNMNNLRSQKDALGIEGLSKEILKEKNEEIRKNYYNQIPLLGLSKEEQVELKGQLMKDIMEGYHEMAFDPSTHEYDPKVGDVAVKKMKNELSLLLSGTTSDDVKAINQHYLVKIDPDRMDYPGFAKFVTEKNNLLDKTITALEKSEAEKVKDEALIISDEAPSGPKP